VFADALQSSFARDCGFHGEAFHLQQSLQGFANLRFVVNNEHRTAKTRGPV
jgi:hypothetical protein